VHHWNSSQISKIAGFVFGFEFQHLEPFYPSFLGTVWIFQASLPISFFGGCCVE